MEYPKKLTATNDVTGALIKSKGDNQESYASGWDAIWGKPKVVESFHVAFNPVEKCSPYLTQCPRCNNPSNKCDGLLAKGLSEAELDNWAVMMGFYDAREELDD